MKMPIKQPLPVLYGDLARARQIARSWKPLDQLSPANAEIVARAIAQGIAEGRKHGLELANQAIADGYPLAGGGELTHKHAASAGDD
jgi:hypothetical protein